MANKKLDKIIQTWWNGWIGWDDDAYNYPSSYKMIAMNVPPYDNDGDQSVQKWIPALDGAYHPIATSLDSSYVASVVEWTGALSIKSKSFSFDSNVAKILDGEIKYGVYIPFKASSIINNVPTADNGIYSVGDSYVIWWAIANTTDKTRTTIMVCKKWNTKSNSTMFWEVISDMGIFYVWGTNTALIEHWVLDNWKKIFTAKVGVRDTAAWWVYSKIWAVVELADGTYVSIYGWQTWEFGTSTFSFDVKEDVNYVYIKSIVGAESDTTRIDKVTWTTSVVAISWTDILLTDIKSWTDLLNNYESPLVTDWVWYKYVIDWSWSLLIKPTDFVDNWLSIDLEINWVVADTITIAADWPAVTNWTISLLDETVWASNIVLDLKTDATHLGYTKYGFWLTGWDYTAPTGTNDASWDWTSGRDVWANWSYLNIELAA